MSTTITRIISCLLSIALFSPCSIAQEVVSVISSGRSITRDLTPELARIKAIEDAKGNALRKAGISENLNITSLLTTSQRNEEVTQLFDEFSTSEINGAIIVDTLLQDIRNWDENNNMIIDVEIRSTVYKYNDKRDPSFNFKIEGLKDIYYENERMIFSITPSKNGFLKIFTLFGDKVELLYPYKSDIARYLDDKEDSLFFKNKTISFPPHPAYKKGYTLQIKSNSKEEASYLFFIYLKQNLPFLKNISSVRALYSWIYGIPVNQRVVELRVIRVLKNLSEN